MSFAVTDLTASPSGTPSYNLQEVLGITAPAGNGVSTLNTLRINIASDNSPLAVTGTFFQATQPVSGTIAVSNFPSTQPVSGTVTALQGTSPWVVSGTVSATQSGTWTTGRTWSLLNTTDSVNSVQSGTWNLNNISGTISLPTGAATAANQTTAITNQTNGSQITQVSSLPSIPTGTNTIGLVNQGLPNTTANSWPVEITDGTNTVTIRPVSTPAVGTNTALVVAQSPNKLATYSAAVINATLPTPFINIVGYFFALQGSATKTIRITRLNLSGLATTTGQHTFSAYTATDITAGTPTAVPAASYDSTNPAATAVATAYESGATPGGIGVSLVRSWSLFMPAVGGNVSPTQINEQLGNGLSQPIVLRGTSQYFTFAQMGAAIPGAEINAYIEWTEE